MNAEVQAFLNEHKAKGRLSKNGTFTLNEPAHIKVPYDLLPLRVKKQVQKMGEIPLCKESFTDSNAYYSAVMQLYTYGYLTKNSVTEGTLARALELRDTRRYYDRSAHIVSKRQYDMQIARIKQTEDKILYREFKAKYPFFDTFTQKDESAN